MEFLISNIQHGLVILRISTQLVRNKKKIITEDSSRKFHKNKLY